MSALGLYEQEYIFHFPTGIAIGLVNTTFTVTEGVQATVCAAIRNGTVAREVDFSIEALAVGTASCKI